MITLSGPYNAPRSKIERNLRLALAIILLAVVIGFPVLLSWYGERRYEQGITDVPIGYYESFYTREGRE